MSTRTAVDRSRAPVAPPPAPLALPEIARLTLPNGLGVLVVEQPRLPLVAVSFVYLSGAGADPAGEEGAAQLAAQLLEEGTASRDSDAIAEAFESIGARMSSWVGWDASGVSVNTLERHLPRVFELLGDVILRSEFPERELERLRDERVAEILQNRSEPGMCASELYMRVLAAGHRFALPQGGDEAAVRALTRERILAAHARRHDPAAARLIVAGAIEVEEVRRLAEDVLGEMSSDGAAVRASDPPPLPDESRGGVSFVARPGAVQSEVRLGHPAPPRSTPDYFPLVVMNTVLGGCFNSRLMLNLREAHGYTYGASSRLDLRRAGGAFVAGAAVRAEVTAPAIAEFRSEIARMAEIGASIAELQYARDYLSGIYPMSFETTGDVANQVAVGEIHSLPRDYIARYQERIQAVTADDVVRAARTYLHPERLTILVHGDRGAIGADLATDLPFTEYDVEGRPVT